MKRKDVVALMTRQFEEKKNIPKLALTHEIIKDNLAIQFEVDKEFKIGRYVIYGNFATFSKVAIQSAIDKVERMREIINRFHRDEVTIEDFNILLKALLKEDSDNGGLGNPTDGSETADARPMTTIPFKKETE